MDRYGVDRVFGYPRSHANEGPEIHDRGIHDAPRAYRRSASAGARAAAFAVLDGHEHSIKLVQLPLAHVDVARTIP